MIRNCNRSVNSLLALYAVALAFPAWAHHSHNAYEVTVWSDLEGTVRDVYLMNPHIGLLSVLHSESKCYSLFLLDL